MSEPRILLTNDDGIDSVGFRALHEALSAVADVVAVAPVEDRSAVGRAMTHDMAVEEHELGYAIKGTPADCTVAGLESLCPDADLVVSGCNKGANISAYVLGRSGTVSAAVEAAFFDVPALAVSLYVPGGHESDWREKAEDSADYRHATEAARYLVEHAPSAGVFEQAEYLNVNAPMPADATASESGRVPMEITSPTTIHQMNAEHDGGRITLHDPFWERMVEGDVPDPPGTDRRALVEGRTSVSPLTAPHSVEHHESLDGLAEAYDD